MVKLLIDESLPARLRDFAECAELCDPDGKTVGFFTPAPEGPPELAPQISDEELERRRRDPRTYSTAEVLAHLKAL